MNRRIISFEQIQNARDMGGLRTANGRIISSGLLIRSANLSEATEADKNILLEKYHVSKIIDLRKEAERNEAPDLFMENVDYSLIPIFDKSVAGISHEKESRNEQHFADIPKLGQLYCKMVTDPCCRGNLGRAARCVMEHDFLKAVFCGIALRGKTAVACFQLCCFWILGWNTVRLWKIIC